MAIKRYSPKYKRLLRYRHPLWYEKRIRITKFRKEKWSRMKKICYPRKIRFFRQDVSAYSYARRYDSEKIIRGKKIYRHILREKQRLQLYYGVGRFRHFQLKNMTKGSLFRQKARNWTPAKALFSLLETRVDVVLYRLGVVNSIPQARKLIQDGRVKLGLKTITNSNSRIKSGDVLSFDPCLKDRLLGLYLKYHTPYFFFRYKEDRRDYVQKRKAIWERSFVERKMSRSLSLMREFLFKIKQAKPDDSIKT